MSRHARGPAARAGRIVVTVDRGMCMGVQSCVRVAPGSFHIDGGRAYGVSDPTDDLATVLEAAEACPNFAITVECDGETVFDPDAP